MPFATHLEFEQAVQKIIDTESDPEFKNDIKQRIKERLGQIAQNTTTNNSL